MTGNCTFVQAATPSYLSHSLIELLNQVSPMFKRNFALLQKRYIPPKCQELFLSS
jgi:hypothetical protein